MSPFSSCRTLRDAERLYTAWLRDLGPCSSAWADINRAFLARWSASSLNKVKREAWRRIKQ